MRKSIHIFIGLVFVSLALSAGSNESQAPSSSEEATRTWAISEFGQPKYANGFTHFPYVNADAPKGGRLLLGEFGSFDTLNFYVLKGEWPSSINIVYDSLMVSSGDEIDALYGLIAENVQYPADKSWAIFQIQEQARYHDGKPITAFDFVFALDTIKEHARPFVQSFYEDVESAEALDAKRVKFNFKTTDTMKPIKAVAGMSPLPVHYWQDKDITAATLTPPLSSGPYRVKKVDEGRSITYERVKDYWGKDLPVNVGRYNFDEIRYVYYRDLTVEFEAFKAGEIDIRSESSAKRWVTEYDFDAVQSGKVLKQEPDSNSPRGIAGYFFNMRRPQFQDIRVREALVTLYDFEAIQRTLLFGKYARINSYFPNSEYGATGVPTDAVKQILAEFSKDIPKGTMQEAFTLPVSDGTGRDRRQLRRALALFKEAGWVVQDGKLVSQKSGEQMQFELMTGFPESQRLALPYIETLKRVGIDASIRLVDTAQWRARVNDNDFDVLVARLNFFPPPGTELRSFYGSLAADQAGGNSGGIKNKVVDELIERIIAADDKQSQVNNMKALDRVLLWNHYVIPTYYNDKVWLAYWDKFGRPKQLPKYELGISSTWWIDESKQTALQEQ